MYKVEITTKYNTINIEVENLYSEEFLQIVEQPYVIEVKVERIKEKVLKK